MKIELRLQVSGPAPAVLLMHGVAADISSGGVSCAVNLTVPSGTLVSVRFPDLERGTSMAPETITGRVVRAEPVGGIPGRLALEFAEPLTRLRLDRRDPASESDSSMLRDTIRGNSFGCSTTFGRAFS